MNFLSILKYSLILFVVEVLVGMASTMLWGADNYKSQPLLDYFICQYLPLILPSLLVLSYYAKVQAHNTLPHLVAVVSICGFLGFIIFSALMGEWFFSPLWFIDIPMSALTIGVAMIIGRSLRKG
ncbi:hypothetical protein O5O45_16360 [Hahella aquimaris]|uniref:hypothetical protein n=1 Tax=Hahella sp. HNIBRBA332 TaxID=3015983 RepID=UPI00273B24E6|nr:hypothetical protein [Hahella sp. HNIBRBA332]WLQ11320.1 hypothetical protein O5O45_16360 [Hahella sp. HNIBRBA332]